MFKIKINRKPDQYDGMKFICNHMKDKSPMTLRLINKDELPRKYRVVYRNGFEEGSIVERSLIDSLLKDATWAKL